MERLREMARSGKGGVSAGSEEEEKVEGGEGKRRRSREGRP